MKLTILGSGAWEGIPAPFCSCAVCHEAIKNPGSKNNRSRPQFLFETEHGSFLLEVSPDIRLQSTKFGLPSVTDFMVSHWHFDHLYGLHELLSWMKELQEKPTLHCSIKTKEVIDKEFSYLPLNVNILQPFRQFTLFDVTITPLPVYHMFGRDNNIPEDMLENTFGYLFEHNNRRIVYLGDYYRIPRATMEKIQDIDALIADGTYLLTNQYKNSKPNHMHGDDILHLTRNTHAKAVYYHSISHLTHRTHEELQKALPPSHFISFDGMIV